jgi:hypothetical protein
MSQKRNYKYPVFYGTAGGYNWVNDPFTCPLEQVKNRKSKEDKQKEYNEKHRGKEKKTIMSMSAKEVEAKLKTALGEAASVSVSGLDEKRIKVSVKIKGRAGSL